ncbi:MAG: flavodoxin reductase [Lewinellaceae bacterium]|nr:flavodoxin reductase [Lewinellaceae bacterium]
MSELMHTVRILGKEQLTHDVARLDLERPEGYLFTAGQAIELTINQPGFLTDAAPFTLTGLSTLESLEIIFKSYPSHNGMTLAMSGLKCGDTLRIGKAWDSFEYKSPGVFIAGGAGVTPFIAILRQLAATRRLNGNKLIFANKTAEDIFLTDELAMLLGSNFLNILSREKHPSYAFGRIDADFLKAHISSPDQAFYLCGPGSFSPDIKNLLLTLGAQEGLIISEY